MIRISIVEDFAEMRTTLKRILEVEKDLVCISEHEDAASAIAELPVFKPDIVLLDINLKGANGIEVIRKVKQARSGIQFLMCTVFYDDEKIFEALKAGATGYLLKKSSPEEIRESIRSLHAGGSPMSPEIARRVVASFYPKDKQELETLSERETEILRLISQGFSYKACADKVFISHATVRNHLHNIYEKLQVRNKMEAVNKYLRG